MMFEKMAEAMQVVKALEAVYSKICLRDISDNTILYETGNLRQNMCPSATHTIHLKPDDLKITVSGKKVDVKMTIPIEIHGRNCMLELSQESQNSLNQIIELSITDPLTNLYNRRYIDERLPIDMQTCFSMDEPLSILFIDIDYFKNINDANGHIAGDLILQRLAELLQKKIRKGNGWVARYGGDEMLICLPEINNNIAKKIAERINKAIENHEFNLENIKIPVTCSIGVQTVDRNTGISSVSEILSMVDKKLYSAKRNGRNKVF